MSELVDLLEVFADPAAGLAGGGAGPDHGWGVRRRLEAARALEREFAEGGAHWGRWQAILPALASQPGYPADMKVQMGLVPLGKDPRSGLHEFWHVLSGAEPQRDSASGELRLTEESGLVFVLVPGGEFSPGSQAEDPAEPNFDPWGLPDESPVRAVRLDAFFLSKYEATQGQWERLAGTNPSVYSPSYYDEEWNHARAPVPLKFSARFSYSYSSFFSKRNASY